MNISSLLQTGNFPSGFCSHVGGHTGISLKPISFGSYISVHTCTAPGTGGELSLHLGM